jgi:CDP-glucose 4,6-dehydratase
MENLVAMLESYKNRKVFVTGNTGFKGSWLSCLLDILDAEQMGFALAPNTTPSHFDILKSNSKSIVGDIGNADLIKQSMTNFMPEIVFHLAAQPLVRESYRNPYNTYHTNVTGTLNVLEAVRNCPSVKAVVIITTDKVYENKEWAYSYRETDELGGYDIYSSSKACSEILVKSYQRSFFNKIDYKKTHNILIATARAGNVIGGGDWSEDRLIPDIVRATVENKVVSIRNPDAVRPWQHVLDCLYGYLLLGEKLLQEQVEFAEAWNFAPYSFESFTVKEVAGIARSIWDSINMEFGLPEENFHEAGLLKLDNTKSISLLGWKPRWNTENAIRKTIEWYKGYYLDSKVLTIDQIKSYLGHNGIH